MGVLSVLLVVCMCWTAVVCGDLTLDHRDRVQILDVHNEVRGRQGATRMYKLVWSDTLEEKADRVIENCNFKRQVHTDENLGTMFGFPSRSDMEIYGKKNMINIIVRDGLPAISFNSWAQEKENVASFDTFECLHGKVCGHYKQVVTGDAREMGCAAKYCPTLDMYGQKVSMGWLLACDYDRGTVRGGPSFSVGLPCSECDRGDLCEHKLCVSD